MIALLTCPQHSGRFYEELPNTADYVSYRLACNKEDYPEPYSPPINPTVSFLPQHPYHSPQATTTTGSSSSTSSSKNTFSPPSHSSAIFKYPSVPGLSSPPPGVGAYTFPKEQYVWTDGVARWSETEQHKLFPKKTLVGLLGSLFLDCQQYTWGGVMQLSDCVFGSASTHIYFPCVPYFIYQFCRKGIFSPPNYLFYSRPWQILISIGIF